MKRKKGDALLQYCSTAAHQLQLDLQVAPHVPPLGVARVAGGGRVHRLDAVLAHPLCN